MKKLVLIAAPQLFIALLFAQTSLSQISTRQLSLPAGYEAWPYKHTADCVGNGKKIETYLFGKFERASRELSVVGITSINGEPVLVVHLSEGKTGLTIYSLYLPSITGAAVYDRQDDIQDKMATELLSKRVQDTLGMTEEEISRLFMSSCRPTFYQINDFANDMFWKDRK